MKNLNLKIPVFISVVVLGIVIISCTTNAPKINATESFSLVSPNGIVLANDLDDLKNIIIYNSDIDINKKELKIIDIKYNENDKVSFGIVNFICNAENKSMLVPLKIDDKVSLFVDGKNIYIRELSLKNGQSFENGDAIFNNKLIRSSKTITKTAYVCNGGCCGWSQPNENHYHCGCPVSAGTELILSTSDGCVIQVIEDLPQQ